MLTLLVLCCDLIAAPPKLEEQESFDDFRERWNAWVDSLPADQIIVDDLKAVNDELFELLNKLYNEEQQDWWSIRVAEPGDELWHLTPRIYEDHRDLYDRLDAVARRSYVGGKIPVVDSLEHSIVMPFDQVAQHSLNAYSSIHGAVSELADSSRYLAYHGELDRAIDRFETIAMMYHGLDELPSMLGYLNQNAVGSTLSRYIMDIVEMSEVLACTDEQLAKLQRLLMRVEPVPLERVISFENQIILQSWQSMYRDGAYDEDYTQLYRESAAGLMFTFFEPDPPILPEIHAEWGSPFLNPQEQYKYVESITDAFFEDLQAFPDDQSTCRVITATIEQLGDENRINRLMPVYVHTRLWRVQLGIRYRDQYNLHNNLVIIAVHRHRVRTGSWPETLDAIDAELLPVPAIDLYSGEPLRYMLANGKPRLLALGIDRDDDGGRQTVEKTVPPFQQKSWWYTLDEWESMSEEQRMQYDGDILLMD